MKEKILKRLTNLLIYTVILTYQSIHGDDGSATLSPELTEKPTTPLNTHMARLGQLRDNMDRFWGAKDMQDHMLGMIQEMIDIQKACLKLTPSYIHNAPKSHELELFHYYQYYSLRSLRQLKELHQAINAWELEKAKEILIALDKNRKQAHSKFG